ncbi:MAG TPA: DUF4214 domain-containing protein, partial [Sumerlaeia bacterium]|nr:DUF4214 domain-containing protein [Sumerlaeia bacterium]
YYLTANGSAVAPAMPTDLDLAAEDDTGCSDSDNITNTTASLTISGAVGSGTPSERVLLNEGDAILTSATLAAFRSPGLDVDLAPGAHTITAATTDVNGYESDPSAPLLIIVDVARPEIVLLAPRDPHPGQPESVDFTVAFDEGVTSFGEPSAVTVHHDGTAHTSVTIAPAPVSGGDSPATYTVTVSGITGAGSLSLSVNPSSAFDFAGNATLGGGPSAAVWIEPPSPTPTPAETPEPTATPTPVAPPTATPTPGAPPEPIRALITSFYNLLLARDPEPGAVDAWHHGYFDYALSFDIDVCFVPREMARIFFLSEEYAARSRTDAEFIADCYRIFLDREPSGAELTAWLGGVWNRAEVMTVFSESEEFAARIEAIYPGFPGEPARNFVASMYIGLLDRCPDQAGLEYAASLFDAAYALGGLEGVRAQAKQTAREIMASEEFQSSLGSAIPDAHSAIVARLYRAFLGRFPSDTEAAYWSGELDSGARTTDDLIDLFADSPEFTARLHQRFGQ